MRHARETAKMPMIAPLSAKVEVLLKAAGAHPFGSVFGPFQQRILESQPYKSAVELLEPVKLLPAAVRAPLNKEWQTIESVRLDLLDAAKSLDKEDGRLYDDGVAIDQDAAVLQKRLDDFNADVDNYNRQCAGQPVNQFCTDWFGRIGTARKTLLADIGTHNALVDAWNGRYKVLAVKADAQKKKVSDREATIGTLAGACVKNPGKRQVAIAKLIRQIQSKNRDAAQRAAAALKALKDERCLSKLLPLVIGWSNAASCAMSVIAYFGERPQTARFLVRKLRSRSPEIRRHAALALRHAPQRAALLPLTESVLRDPDESVRTWSLSALGAMMNFNRGKEDSRIREKVLPLLKRAITDPNPLIRQAGFEGLSHARSAPECDQLVHLALKDADKQIRMTAPFWIDDRKCVR